MDSDDARLQRSRNLFPPGDAVDGIELVHLNPAAVADVHDELRRLTRGHGFDDVLVLAANRELIALGDASLGTDRCLNFFAGPTDRQFAAPVNLYNFRYERTHLVGTSAAGAS